jgi:hypothetical protein
MPIVRGGVEIWVANVFPTLYEVPCKISKMPFEFVRLCP